MGSEQGSPLQRFSPGDKGLIYDMRGPWVRFDDHLKALNTERSLADARVERAEKAVAKQPRAPQPTSPTEGDFHPARKQLFEAVKTLRALGWSDGDIIFGAELTMEAPSSFCGGCRTAARKSPTRSKSRRKPSLRLQALSPRRSGKATAVASQIEVDSLRGELREEKEVVAALEESKRDAERLLSKKILELGEAEAAFDLARAEERQRIKAALLSDPHTLKGIAKFMELDDRGTAEGIFDAAVNADSTQHDPEPGEGER